MTWDGDDGDMLMIRDSFFMLLRQLKMLSCSGVLGKNKTATCGAEDCVEVLFVNLKELFRNC